MSAYSLHSFLVEQARDMQAPWADARLARPLLRPCQQLYIKWDRAECTWSICGGVFCRYVLDVRVKVALRLVASNHRNRVENYRIFLHASVIKSTYMCFCSIKYISTNKTANTRFLFTSTHSTDLFTSYLLSYTIYYA